MTDVLVDQDILCRFVIDDVVTVRTADAADTRFREAGPEVLIPSKFPGVVAVRLRQAMARTLREPAISSATILFVLPPQ